MESLKKRRPLSFRIIRWNQEIKFAIGSIGRTVAKRNKRAYYANMLLRPVKEQKLYLGLTWIFMYHSYVLKMDLRTALENSTSVHIQLTKTWKVPHHKTYLILITYFPCSLFRMKRPKSHVARFFWCTRCLPGVDNTQAPTPSTSRFVWLSWWAQKSSVCLCNETK